ncbi:putative late blight resistance protein homolog R1C-3 [Primulina tabacum]|uniref:putative late blight resistance protein homolog R1C-3 n=1 Tax=Primulina tabacum TaxID=48773 RepID=UPI003F5A3991
MAAYASLLSLGHILDHLIQHPPRQRAVLDEAHIHSLLQNITFLQDFLEEFSLTRGNEIQALEEKIARSAHAAEDMIGSRVVDLILGNAEAGSQRSSTLSRQDLQILRNSEAERRKRGTFSHFNVVLKKTNLPFVSSSSTLFSRHLEKVIEEFCSLKKDVMKIKETEGIKIVEQPRNAATASSFLQGASDRKNTMVGFDEDLIQIMETLTGDESNLQILSIVGMGGIGKTTLAKNVLKNPLIVNHFDLRAWVTISQQYSEQKILLGLLKEIGVEDITQDHDDELGLSLHKSLFNRRYFIVMDDMWSIKVWDGIKSFLPDNGNGSRVMVTTRLSNVAENFLSCTPHQLHFLDKDQSWVLFCDKVFGKESCCPPELEEVGKTIVRNCRGLPLAIVAISGLLAKSSPTVEYWEYVAKNTYSELTMGGDGLCFEVFSLSYKHLPVHLKPCFLYMAMFPEHHKIRISRVVKLWTAEAILKPMRYRSLEEIAEDNLKDLIDRNLVQVHDYGSRNKIKTCTIHDLFRDLCRREAQKEKFVCLTMMNSLDNHSRIIDNNRRLISKRSSDEEELKSTFSKLSGFRKVQKKNYIFTDEEIVRLVNSRFIDYDAGIFSSLLNTLESLSQLWNLQTVTIAGVMPINLPEEIWKMPQLRHLKREEGFFNLPDPPSTNIKNGRADIIILENLQTLYKIRNFRCTDEVVHRIPNLKKLGITYKPFSSGIGWDYHEVYNLSNLHNLESLIFDSHENVLRNLRFPQSLKKLTLERCGVSWEDLTVVGSLRHLEVLDLMHYAAKGREWNPVEGQFLELKSLRIELTDLVEWKADRSHFPGLEKLELRCLRSLKEIPEDIGEIPTLRSISLVLCSESAYSSAKKIQEEQQNLGNYELLVQVPVSWVGYETR